MSGNKVIVADGNKTRGMVMIKWERGKKLVGDGCGEKGGRKLDVQSIVFVD